MAGARGPGEGSLWTAFQGWVPGLFPGPAVTVALGSGVTALVLASPTSPFRGTLLSLQECLLDLPRSDEHPSVFLHQTGSVPKGRVWIPRGLSCVPRAQAEDSAEHATPVPSQDRDKTASSLLTMRRSLMPLAEDSVGRSAVGEPEGSGLKSGGGGGECLRKQGEN